MVENLRPATMVEQQEFLQNRKVHWRFNQSICGDAAHVIAHVYALHIAGHVLWVDVAVTGDVAGL